MYFRKMLDVQLAWQAESFQGGAYNVVWVESRIALSTNTKIGISGKPWDHPEYSQVGRVWVSGGHSIG